MTYSTDRDLLVVEPFVFKDVPLLSQQRAHFTDGVIVGTTLTSASSNFTAAKVGAGGVLLIDHTPLEVVERVDANTLTVSLLRGMDDESPIAPGDGADIEALARTFSPQAQVIHNVLRRLFRLNGLPDGAVVLSTELLRELEALGTLERVYTAAVSAGAASLELHHKMKDYRTLFQAACRQAHIGIDTDGDGAANLVRTLDVVKLVRT